MAVESAPWVKWSKLQVKGTLPSRRDCHSAVLYNGGMYVFGGWNGDTLFADLHLFNFESKKWEVLDTKGQNPTEREGHSAVVYKDKMVIFGGQGDGINFQDCYTFSFETLTWEVLDTQIGDAYSACASSSTLAEDSICSTSSTVSEPILNRFYHSAVVFRDQMYVFGGCDDNEYFSDLISLDFPSKTWRSIRAKGTPPSRRYCHSSVVYGDSMYVFGGCADDKNYADIHEYSFTSAEWKPVYHRGGIPPSPRYGHICCVDELGNFMVLYGGCVESTRYNCVYVFCFDDRTWHNLKPDVPPLKVAGHTGVYLDGSVFVFGGFSDDDAYNEIYTLQLDNKWVEKQRSIGAQVDTVDYVEASAAETSSEEEDITDSDDEREEYEEEYDGEEEEYIGEEDDEEEDEEDELTDTNFAASAKLPTSNENINKPKTAKVICPMDKEDIVQVQKPPKRRAGPGGEEAEPRDKLLQNLDSEYSSSTSIDQPIDFAAVTTQLNANGMIEMGGRPPPHPSANISRSYSTTSNSTQNSGYNQSTLPSYWTPPYPPSPSVSNELNDLQRQIRRYQDQVKESFHSLQERYDEDRRHWENRTNQLFQQYLIPQHQLITQLMAEVRHLQLTVNDLSRQLSTNHTNSSALMSFSTSSSSINRENTTPEPTSRRRKPKPPRVPSNNST